MGIRKKILLYFSLSTILLTGVALFFIYTLFSEYREEEFQQRQKEKIKSTLFFLSEIRKADEELTEAIDRLTINEIYDEKLLIFNSRKELVYSSIDDTPIQYSKEILENLSPENEWFESKDKLYDIVALYFENQGNTFYGISKAFDKFGYSKLNYLKWVLFLSFIIIAIAVFFLAYVLSGKITQPLISITRKISNFSLDDEYSPIEFGPPNNEIALLADQFNKLVKKMNAVFAFQKHAVHHISHELKTPIAVLVSNFEKIEQEQDITQIRRLIRHQKEDTKDLGEIINSLLEISKAETGIELKRDRIRIDELIYDVIDELRNIHPDFQFSVEYASQSEEEVNLVLAANHRLIRAAMTNLLLNSIQYSDNGKAGVLIRSRSDQSIEVVLENKGATITGDENQFLFRHFFRGGNSQGKRGFGLGLVFVHKIISLHGGSVSYETPDSTTNVFKVRLPLS